MISVHVTKTTKATKLSRTHIHTAIPFREEIWSSHSRMIHSPSWPTETAHLIHSILTRIYIPVGAPTV